MLILSVLYLVNTGEVSAFETPLISQDGTNVGKATTGFRGDHRVVDFDFNNPSTCLLQTVQINSNNSTKTYRVTGSNQTDENFDGITGTYIAPRDAVLPIESDNFSADLTFNCNGVMTMTSINKHPFVEPQRRFFPPIDMFRRFFHPRNDSLFSLQPTPTPQPTFNPSSTFYEGRTSGDGLYLHFDSARNEWEYVHNSVNPTPTPSPSFTPQPTFNPSSAFYEGRTSGDGLYLHFDSARNEWEYVHR